MKFFSRFFNKKYLTVTDEKGKLNIFALTIPLFLENIGVHLIGVVQTMMSSHYADGLFVIPTSVSNSVIALYQTVVLMLVSGMSVVLSICIGRKKSEDCKSVIGTTFIAGLVFAIIVGIIMLIFARPFLSLMGIDSADYLPYKEYAVTYYYYRVPAIIITVISSVMTTALRCNGFTKVGLYCSLTANVVNAIVTALAMFVLNVDPTIMGHGLGIISLFSTIVNLVLVFIYFRYRKIEFRLHFSWRWCKNIFKIGFPATICGIFWNLSQTVTASLMLSLEPSAYLAKNYITQIVFFVYILGYSLGQANAILMGRICGNGDFAFADKMNMQNVRIVLSVNIILSLSLAFLGPTMLRLMFNASDSVIAYAQVALFIDIIVEIGRGFSHVCQYALNATGDVNYTSLVSLLSCGGFAIGFAFLFVSFGWGLAGIWSAFAIDELFRGVLFFIRWRSGGWRKRFDKSVQ